MQYRRFGKTELEIPVISCGGMRYQAGWKDDDTVSEDSQKNLEACIHKALEVGINHIETARGYGTSEEQLGRILPTLKRDELIVQTKVGPEAEVQKFVNNFEKSMSLLKLDYVDLFSFHGINFPEHIEYTKRCMDTALQWKKEGRIRHIGFSTHAVIEPYGEQPLLDALDLEELEYVNLHWFYIFQGNWPAILKAREKDMGVFIISPNDKGGMLYKPSPKLQELCAPLDPMAFNALFCLSHPEVHTLSCGVARPEDFDVHVEAVKSLDNAEALVAPIVERLENAMVEALGEAWVKSWEVGLPLWRDTPGEMNIPTILRLRNLAVAFDMVEYGKMRYNFLGNGESWFPGNRANKLDEMDLTECLKNSPHAAAIPHILAETNELLKGEEQKRLQQEDE